VKFVKQKCGQVAAFGPKRMEIGWERSFLARSVGPLLVVFVGEQMPLSAKTQTRIFNYFRANVNVEVDT